MSRLTYPPGGGAPTDADYVVETANPTLSAEAVLGTSVITSAAHASRQAAAKAGRLFLPTDGLTVYRDDGAAWKGWGPLWNLTEPVNGDFAWINQGGATVAAMSGAIHLTAPAVAGTNIRMRTRAAPAVPFTVVAAFLPLFPLNDAPRFTVGFNEATSGKFSCLEVGMTPTAGLTPFFLALQNYNSPTSFAATIASSSFGFTGMIFMLLSDDGTNLYFGFSLDGLNFHYYGVVARTTFLTNWATASERKVFWGIQAQNATRACGVTLTHWKQS